MLCNSLPQQNIREPYNTSFTPEGWLPNASKHQSKLQNLLKNKHNGQKFPIRGLKMKDDYSLFLLEASGSALEVYLLDKVAFPLSIIATTQILMSLVI